LHAGAKAPSTRDVRDGMTVARSRAMNVLWRLLCLTILTAGCADHTVLPTKDSGVPDDGPAHVVGACDSLPAVGDWEQVTPPMVATQLPGPGSCTFGTSAFVLDPTRSGTVYLGTCNMGLWKTTDCGANWVHIDTGRNGAILDSSRQWTFAIDPIDPNVLYTNSGYGAMSNGAFKSINGGVDWDPIWPPADPALANVVDYNFVGLIALDPTDHEHLLLSFHGACKAPHAAACYGESHDGGASWTLADGHSDWSGGEAQTIYFLDDSRTWLWSSNADGLWRTNDSGASWTLLDVNVGGHNASPVYHSKTGAFYLAMNSGIHRSADGTSWSNVLTNTTMGVTGNGTTLFASIGFPWNPGQGPAPYQPFWTSAESDGQTWRPLASPPLTNGGSLAYDVDHHILYSSNLDAGFWRVVTE
jgi:hypothetical protein